MEYCMLTIVIERTMSEFGGEETGRALVAVVDRWRSSDYKMTGDDDLSFPEIGSVSALYLV